MSTQEISYVDYDFSSLCTTLQTRLAAQSAWKDTYKSSTGEMLLELFAAVGTLVLYYVERRAEESYIATAKNKSSVINLARLLNYIPDRNVSATGVLRFTLTSTPTDYPVYIPQYTSCSSSTYNYLVATETTIMSGTYIDVSCIQGTLVPIEYTSSGSLSQEYNINDTKIENSNVFVTVDGGVPWTQVTSFINSTTTSHHYVIRPELDDTITIVFGNGVYGESPSLGKVIIVSYIQSDGLAGNVYSTGLITTLNDVIRDKNGVAQTVTVTNTSNILGGDDIETIEEIRTNAPNVFATGDRLVTALDFTTIINSYSGVADSIVWGENEETNPDYTHYNQVKICVILDEWALPDTVFKAALSDDLYEKSIMTVRYSYVDPVILEVIPEISVKVLRNYALALVQAGIDDAISDQFILGTTSKLSMSKRSGDIVAAIEGVTGVSYSHSIMTIRKELLPGYLSGYAFAETLDALPVLESNVEIYIDDVSIAIDNGSGTFTSTGGTYTVTGVVSYSTGAVSVNISPSPDPLTTVYARYQQDEDGDIVISLNQICKWIENSYTSISYV